MSKDINLIYGYLPINYEKSIKRQRLIYKMSFDVVFDYFFVFAIALFLIAAITIPAIIKPVNISRVSIFYIIPVITIDLWIIVNVILTNSLIKINIDQSQLDKNGIELVLSNYFKNITLQKDGQKIFRFRKNSGLFTGIFPKIITVLLAEQCIYINITALGRFDTLSPFHGLANYIKCKRIKEFSETKSIGN
jgi:hypothetical protein